MKLHHLLKGIEVVAIKGNKYIDIDNISYDSKQLKMRGLFFAIKGSKLNGFDFIDEAIERGAICVVSEEDFITYKNVCKVLVDDVRKAITDIWDRWGVDGLVALQYYQPMLDNATYDIVKTEFEEGEI